MSDLYQTVCYGRHSEDKGHELMCFEKVEPWDLVRRALAWYDPEFEDRWAGNSCLQQDLLAAVEATDE